MLLRISLLAQRTEPLPPPPFIFDLILSLYQLPPNHPAVADLRESLRGAEMR